MRKKTPEASDFSPIINISLFDEEPESYEFDQKNSEWVGEILKEIENDFFDEELPKGEGKIQTNLEVKRLVNNIYGEHLIVRGEAKGQYYAACVRCLDPSFQEFECDFRVAFINSRYEKEPEYEEITHIFADGEDVELYFHEKGKANVKEMLHEQVYMHLEPLPLHAEDCKGLCGQCGSNLNKDNCGHN